MAPALKRKNKRSRRDRRRHQGGVTTRADQGPPERWQHHDHAVEQGDRPGVQRARAISPLEALHRRQRGNDGITERRFLAGRRLREDYELGICGAHDKDDDLPPGVRTGGSDGLSAAQLDAAGRYRGAVRAMGTARHEALALVIDEWTVQQIATWWGRDQRAVMGRIEAALDTLADHYEQILGSV